jgi:hypothetical protein
VKIVDADALAALEAPSTSSMEAEPKLDHDGRVKPRDIAAEVAEIMATLRE